MYIFTEKYPDVSYTLYVYKNDEKIGIVDHIYLIEQIGWA